MAACHGNDIDSWMTLVERASDLCDIHALFYPRERHTNVSIRNLHQPDTLQQQQEHPSSSVNIVVRSRRRLCSRGSTLSSRWSTGVGTVSLKSVLLHNWRRWVSSTTGGRLPRRVYSVRVLIPLRKEHYASLMAGRDGRLLTPSS